MSKYLNKKGLTNLVSKIKSFVDQKLKDLDIDTGLYAKQSDMEVVQAVIPSDASASNKLSTKSDLDIYQERKLSTSGALIEAVIPSDASASNKLVVARDNNFKYTDLGDPEAAIDANDLKETGVYSVYGQSNKHFPYTGWNVLYVTRANNSSSYVQQMCIDIQGTMYKRNEFGKDNWSSWKKLVTTADLAVNSYKLSPIMQSNDDVADIVVIKTGSVVTLNINEFQCKSNKSIYETLFTLPSDSLEPASGDIYAVGVDMDHQTTYPIFLQKNTKRLITTVKIPSDGYFSATLTYIIKP